MNPVYERKKAIGETHSNQTWALERMGNPHDAVADGDRFSYNSPRGEARGAVDGYGREPRWRPGRTDGPGPGRHHRPGRRHGHGPIGHPPAPHHRFGGLQQLEDLARELEQWSSQYSSAPSGSVNERIARQEMEQVGRTMVAIAADVRHEDLGTLELAADQFYQRYRAAPAGSRSEATYESVARSLFDAMPRVLDFMLEGAGYGDQDLVRLGDEYQSKYDRASSGSMAEACFRQMAERSYAAAIRVFGGELEYARDYRGIEQRGEDYRRMYHTAPAGSTREATAAQLAELAFAAAERIFQDEVDYMSRHQRYDLARDYESKYNSAPAASPEERHYELMKNIAMERS